MVEIKLDQTSGSYDGSNETVKVTTSDYQTNFKLIKYEIEYKNTYSSSVITWWWNSTYFYVYLKNKNQQIFEYRPTQEGHVVKSVEVYYATKHQSIYLVIVFELKHDKRCFTYAKLKKEKYIKGYLTGGFDARKLYQKLKAEDDRVNRIKFLNTNHGSKNCKEVRQTIDGSSSLKFCYTPEDKNRYEDHILTKDQLFKYESGIEVNKSYFDSVNEQYYDEVNVYRTNENHSKILLVEFSNFNNGNKYFSRQDKYGYYWIEKKEIVEVTTELKKIEDEYRDKLAYLIDKKGGYNGVTVTNSKDKSFDKYVHTLQSEYQNKKSYILQNGNLLTRQKINEISRNKLTHLQNQTFKSVSTFYKKVGGAELPDPPFFLELAGSGNTKYYLQRVDNEGIKWTQVNKTADNLKDDSIRNGIIKEINYLNTKSIAILTLKKNSEYPINLVDNSVSDIFNPETQPQTTNKITVKQNQESLSDYKYKSYEHSLTKPPEPESPQTTTPDFLTQVSGLRIFIGSSTKDNVDLAKSVEIKLHNNNGSERKYLYYDSSSTNQLDTERKNKVYCYFYGEDNVPLMIYGGGFFYRPKSLNQYFDKWVQIPGITIFKDKSSVDSKLKDINKELNLIDLVNTKTYGLKGPDSGQLPQDFSKDRITVTTETPSDRSHLKVKHTTTNKGTIGKINHSGSELVVLTDRQDTGDDNPMIKAIEGESTSGSTTIYNTLYAYYHSSDSAYNKPLLIGISKSSNEKSNLFFQRVDITDNSKWKKIQTRELSSLKDDTALTTKINQINYNIKKSIVVQMHQQTSSGYCLMLVQNGTKSASPDEQRSGAKINVSDDTTACKLSGNYKCYNHSISLGDTTASEIAGLRFFIDKDEMTFFHGSSTGSNSTPIFYNQGHNNVHVYFHNKSKVPLLLAYDNKYYGPSSRDNYFEKWLQKDVKPTHENNLPQKLDEINRNLNVVDISETTNGTKYGIPKPQEPPKESESSFYERILVKCCKNDHYRKITHSTINGSQIGNILYQGKSLTGIETNNTQANEVSVYYQVSDFYYSLPLLIKICSNINNKSCQWYYRNSNDCLQWKNESNSSKYNGKSKIKDELDNIYSNLFVVLNINMETHQPYDVLVFGKGKTYSVNLGIDKHITDHSLRVQKHRCFEHQFRDYYEINKSHIKNILELEQDPTFSMCFQISGKKVTFFDKFKKFIPFITYGPKEYTLGKKIYIYFYEDDKRSTDETDKIPLLLNCMDRFFIPETKESYFYKWKEIDSLSGKGITELEKQLNSVNLMLNEVDLTKREAYGIQCCNNHEFFQNGKFNSKRISVTKFDNKTHSMFLHTTVNKYIINTITHSNDSYNFNQHSQLLKHTIDEVAVVVEGSDNLDTPLLVLLNQKDQFGYSSSTFGYYYKKTPRGDTFTEYTFQAIDHGYNIISILKGEEQDGLPTSSDSDQIQSINSTLEVIRKDPLKVKTSSQPEKDTRDCKGPIDSKFALGKCPEDDGAEDSTHTVRESSPQRPDDRPKLGQDRSTGIDPGGRGPGILQASSVAGLTPEQGFRGPPIPEQVPAAPQGPVGPSGKNGEKSAISEQTSHVQIQRVEQHHDSQHTEVRNVHTSGLRTEQETISVADPAPDRSGSHPSHGHQLFPTQSPSMEPSSLNSGLSGSGDSERAPSVITQPETSAVQVNSSSGGIEGHTNTTATGRNNTSGLQDGQDDRFKVVSPPSTEPLGSGGVVRSSKSQDSIPDQLDNRSDTGEQEAFGNDGAKGDASRSLGKDSFEQAQQETPVLENSNGRSPDVKSTTQKTPDCGKNSNEAGTGTPEPGKPGSPGSMAETGEGITGSAGSAAPKNEKNKPTHYTGNEEFDKIIDSMVTYCKENPVVVGGASSAVTVATSSYPFYKLILKCIRKK